MFRSVAWQLVTDVLGQLIGPVFEDQAVAGGSWPATSPQISLACQQILLH